MKLQNNIILDTDAYKETHHLLFKKGLTNMYSYGESRIGSRFDSVLFYGAQIICIDHLVGQVVDEDKINEAEKECEAYFGTKAYFNRKMWEKILYKYDGKLPLRIKAVKEGTKVPINNVLFTIESLDDECVPLVQHIETLFMQIWYSTTIATNSHYIKQNIYKFLKETGSPELIEYMCHDFGYRACTCQQQAAKGGSAHLISFRGSDTNVGDRALKFYYGTKEDSILKSVMASEHSVETLYGSGEGEYDYVKACIDAAPPDKIISVVGDGYNIYNFSENVLTRSDVKEKILNRTGKFVVRPDSGTPDEVVNRIINSLANGFGFSYNDKHHKVLNPRVGIIQGDGMTRETMTDLYKSIISNKWSADNLVVGSGGGLLQKDIERDTQKFAIKASQATVNGEQIDVFKSPTTQSDKKSKRGKLKLHNAGGSFTTLSSSSETPQMFHSYLDSLETIFEMGDLKRRQTFDEIREIANQEFR